MSWFRDPQLFLRHDGSTFIVYRVAQLGLSVGNILSASNLTNPENYSFSKHFSLGNNKESDYAVFLSDLQKRPNHPFVNSQGFVFTDYARGHYILSRQPPDSPFYSLPGLPAGIKPAVSVVVEDEQKKAEKIADLEKKVSDLQQQLQREKAERETDKKQISELTAKLNESGGVGGESIDGEPLVTGHPVPRNFVSYDDLDVGAFPKDNRLNITKLIKGAPKFGEDKTTNVKPNRFRRGVFPIVVVNVAELTPKQNDARFDPEIWSLYNNDGTMYAARKPFASEMLV